MLDLDLGINVRQHFQPLLIELNWPPAVDTCNKDMPVTVHFLYLQWGHLLERVAVDDKYAGATAAER